ncbi:MAG: bifunctional UDP-N-acetylmuramoyl-tripeptide:D-alanyl-D-alanine ligase/alanine racemase [Bacteroidales bacterium]|nr:bifunctional UDP-N-acetylmuramoyl-tripeptide:D-alanyl-D-alanine ligase/alanine racemase [Bacteroidales bacterium]
MKAIEITRLLRPAEAQIVRKDAEIEQLLTDSRKISDETHSLFFAIPTKHNTGCRYVDELYQRGVRNFVVPNDVNESYRVLFQHCSEANFWYVKNVVWALQQIAAGHRRQFQIPVVGITGSNGKTVVKDWIVQMLSGTCKTVSSPRSYNSQIGVPLSVWQMDEADELAVFEAGISEAGEMEALRNVIDPTIGIFTNIGQAHDENFLTREQKIAEKLQLFTHCEALIYCTDHKEIHSVLSEKESFREVHRYTWGRGAENDVQLLDIVPSPHTTTLTICHAGKECNIAIPFSDRASVENALHCITLMFYLGLNSADIARRCLALTSVAMRLEMNEAINDCLLINDSYSLDLNSLSIALDYILHERQYASKTLIMSDILQSGLSEQDLYAQASALIAQHGITRFIGIGSALIRNKALFERYNPTFYATTEDFIRQHNFDDFRNATILLKGARLFHFEDIARLLQRKSHQTIMEVNLDNLISNLNYYRSLLRPTTKLMAMVKASSYGAGKVEVASALQYNHVDYLTVAYTDEGVDLRRNGIMVPIMVMNPEEESFDDIIRYDLEPDIYSFRIFEAFSNAVRMLGQDGVKKMPVHVEFDTGMHRLGFSGNDIQQIVERFSDPSCVLRMKSIFSHLACSEDAEMDDFTHLQIDRFVAWSGEVKQQMGDSSILCHILNSSGITRFTDYQFDMVRLGIGLYGIAPEPTVQSHLKPVSRLITRISQLKAIPKGDSVGYNRRWVAQRDSKIAIISIGYADGLNRHLGYENGRVLVKGKLVPIIGSICMDMCFLDVTDVDCKEGEEVVIFGDAELLQQISSAAETIPYEILTSVSPRVKRIYYQE